MTLRCKPGQVCEVIKSRLPENIGRWVLVLEAAPEKAAYFDGQPCWWVKPLAPMPCVHVALGFRYAPTMDCIYGPDAWLRPLRGLDEPESISQPEAVSA